MTANKRVVIVHDGVAETAPPDQQDTLVQVQAVATSLERLGWTVVTVPVGLDLSRARAALQRMRPACVFNLAESVGGDGRLAHLVPALLESSAIAFTGSSMEAVFLSSGKPLAKHWLAAHGLDTPHWWLPADGGQPDAGVWIVKSAWEHASLGLDQGSIVPAEAVATRIRNMRARHGGDWFAERYVPGREFNLSLLRHGGEVIVLPPAEICFDGFGKDRPRIVDYAAKWQTDSFEFLHTSPVYPSGPEDQPLLERLVAMAHRCWSLFRLEGYARVDFRVDEQGRPWILEVNANPCLSPDAGFAAALSQAGRAFDDVIAAIVEAALNPQPQLTQARRGPRPARVGQR